MILGILVTFNPDLNKLSDNLQAIKGQLDRLVVYDNDSKNISELILLCSRLDVELVQGKTNIGLGSAYNFVIKKNIHSFDFFVTFDQDTLIPPNIIYSLLSYFDLERGIGIVGPSFTKVKSKKDFQYVQSLIQSCSIFSKEVFHNAGFFNEEFFIDSVDFEFCLRASSKNFKIIRSNKDFIFHELGVVKKRYGISYIDHNSFRNYYIARNHRFITQRYFKYFPYFILKKNFFFVLHFLKLIFLSQNVNKVQSFIKGLTLKSK